MDMNNCLNRFAAGSLFDASSAMLSQLKIKFTPQTREPIPFRDMYTRAMQMPKALDSAYAKVADCYFVGAIDEDSLAGRDSSFAIGERTNEICEGRYCSMLVFAVDIKPGERLTRSEIATLTRGFNRLATALPVILFVRNGDSLSLAAIERSKYTQAWRNGEKLGKVSILRDINVSHPHRGHIEILNSLGDKAYPSFEKLYEHWFSVFSSDLLTKKFYSELSDWYAWAVQTVRFPNDLNSSETDSKHNNESVIRLITRLIFVWFLKQKHLIPNEFFNEEDIRDKFIGNFDPNGRDSLLYDTAKSKYYRLILQNLFFAMLNRPIVAEDHTEPDNRRFRVKGRQEFNINNLMRYEDEFKAGGAQEFERIANSTVPFLNGGLFECLDKKSAENGDCYYDGFSERKASLERLYVPDCLFFGGVPDFDLSKWYGEKKKKKVQIRGLIDILQSYCFTVEENTPLDQEVSLDPELLGKVFENLLASYNPETQTNARKQTGSFYTPRQIVQYMVDESLVAHLCRVCGKENEQLYRDLLSYTSDAPALDDDTKKEIISALYSCKVLDPACGSGAFPMGILQQMVHVLRKLDPENTLWHDFVVGIATDKSRDAYATLSEEELNARIEDIKQSFNRSVNDPDYARKLYLIENCIYGVDIQPIAIQISKLRCFISLVAEQKPTQDAKSNFGIRPLPNLEAKFVAANTLISLKKGHDNLFTETPEILTIKKQLSEANHKLFLAKRNADKKRIREAIRGIRERYKNALVDTGAVDSDSAMQLANWDMFEQNVAADFFNSQWMFGISDGFDIVIGNPPYCQVQKRKYSAETFPYSEGKDVGKQNLYKLFIEYSYNALKSEGVACLIVQSSLMCDMSSSYTRELLLKKTTIKHIIEFPKIAPTTAGQVFSSVCQGTCICTFSKAEDTKNRFVLSINNDKTTIDDIRYTKISQDDIITDFPLRYEIPLLVDGEIDLVNKLKRLPKLKNYLTKSLQGNINTIHLKRIQSAVPTPVRILKGAHVHRYHLSTSNIMYGLENEEVHKLYTSNADAGAVIATQNITGTVDEYRIHASIAECKNTPMVFLHSVNVLHLPSPRIASIILACLNSKLLDWLFRKTSTNNHCNMYELEDLPIFEIDKISNEQYSRILDLLANPIQQNMLNIQICKLYGLTFDEVFIIDPHIKISRNDYWSVQ